MLTRRSLLLLSGAAVVGLAGAGAWLAGSTPAAAETLTPAEAHAAAGAGEILLIDIRRPDEWAATGVPEHGHAFDMRDEGFVAQVTGLRASGTQPVALICAGGVRSAWLTQRLTEAGLGPILDVPEGMLGSRAGPGWLERGLPVTEAG